MRKKILRAASIFMVFLMLLSAPGLVFGADIESINDESKELEEYLTGLVTALESKSMELSDIDQRIQEVDESIDQNTELLETATKASEVQKKNMKKRIKYMYESSGDMNLIEAILTSESIGDVINRVSYVSDIVGYDRRMFEEYVMTINSINSLNKKLIESRDMLTSLQTEYGEKGTEFSAMVAAVPEQMAEFGIEEADVSKVIEEFINDNPELIVSAEEEDKNIDTSAAVVLAEDANDTEPTEAPKQEITTDQAVTEAPTEAPVVETEAPPETEAPAAPAEEPAVQNSDPVWNLARITYLENGVMYPESSYKSIYLTACVVINRANAWYGGSIMDSIYAPGAYATAYKYDSWTGGELVINDITWQAVNEALANPDPNVFYQCNGSWLAAYGLKEYYRDPVTDEVFYYAN